MKPIARHRHLTHTRTRHRIARIVEKWLLARPLYLRKAKQQEAIAHFSSLIQGPQFSDAMGFVAESMDLIDFLLEYLEAIEV